MSELEETIIDVEELTDAVDERLITLKEHFENNELSNEELDFIADYAVEVCKRILSYFGENNSTIDEYESEEGTLILDIKGGDLAVLIGRHGRVLDSLQVSVNSMLSSKLKFHFPVDIDIEGYKSRRRNKIRNIALQSAKRAIDQGSRVVLPPMSAYERRLIHMYLIEDEKVTTHSEGEDPNRRVVITPLS